MKKWQVFGWVLIVFYFSFQAVAAENAPLNVLHVTPSGEDVYPANQIVITFNRPVVPLGKMERKKEELPITITPEIPCEWRWLNTSSLACNLPEQTGLVYATKYTIEIKPGIKAQDGETLKEAYTGSFITQRAHISYKDFHLWKAPGLPVIQLVFNQPVSKQSLEQEGEILVGNETVKLKVYPDDTQQDYPFYLPLPGEKYAAFIYTAARKPDDRKTGMNGQEARRVWLVEPEKPLPLNSHAALAILPGLVSAFGAEKTVDKQQVAEFDTFPEFAFLGLRCTANDKKTLTYLNDAIAFPVKKDEKKPDSTNNADVTEITIPAWSILTAGEKCNPLAPVALLFNTPVERAVAAQSLHFIPEVKGWTQKEASQEEGEVPEEAQSDYNDLSRLLKTSNEKGKIYEVWLPAGLKAAQKYQVESRIHTLGYFARFKHWVVSWFKTQSPLEVVDMFGRPLAVPIALTFATDHRLPHFVFDHHNAVLEKAIDSEVPLFVNNIDKIILNYQMLSGVDATPQQFTTQVPKVEDIQFAIPLGIREALKGKNGALYGSLSTQPVTDTSMYESRIFAQVTPYQVHVKFGHFSSLAWVTDLSTGKPVEGANVSLTKNTFATFRLAKAQEAGGITNEDGIAVLPGTMLLDPELKVNMDDNDNEEHFFVKVIKGEDTALLPLSSNFMINTYRATGSDETISPRNKERYGHMHAWGMTAQGIYRAGDIMQYKIYVRNQDDKGFIAPPSASYTLRIFDALGKKVHEQKSITLSEFGSVSGEYTLPKTASVGWYSFKLSASFDGKEEEAKEETIEVNDSAEPEQDSGKNSWVPMKVLVSDFTPSSFKVSGQLNGDLFRAGQEVTSTTKAELHSGGAYGKASARITALLQSLSFTSKHPLAQNFQFDSYVSERDSQQVFQKIEALNDKGELQQAFSLGKPGIVYGKLLVESAVQDERGKYISATSTANYIGVDRLVGLHSKDWLYSTNKQADIEVIVVDEKGVPVEGSEINVSVEHQVTTAARVKSAGNAYLTQYNNSWEAIQNCKLVSAKEAVLCHFTPKEAGSYRTIATLKDTKGNTHNTILSGYATGTDFVLWGDGSDTSLSIIPEKIDYKIGDTARFLVKNPYPGATALITVERYGIIDQLIKTLEGSSPVVELPIKPDYLPGFYLSVTIISPRVDKPLEGKVDLGKPAFRMGYVSVNVKDPYKEMTVTAKTDAAIYKPRDKVTLKLHTEPTHKDKAEPIEMAVVVLDEAVFDLIAKGRDAFDPYKGFYKLEALDLRNFSLLLNLVGRQKFEKKGANPGGDGGHDLGMRTLFKFVSYWNPSVIPDEKGNASITFEAPDNLTGWRVLAIASTPSDRFGLVEADFKVNRPTEIRPVMPNQVTEGDSFNAGFSVMNRTDKERDITITLEATGQCEEAAPLTQTVKLPAYQRTTVFMPIKTTASEIARESQEGKITFHATAQDATDSDAIEHSLVVHKQHSLEVAVNYATTQEKHTEESIAFPANLVPDVGGVSLTLSPTVLGNIAGAFRYMQHYPYMCWEQQLTKGVMAAHFKQLKPYLPDELLWEGSSTLPQTTLDNASSFQAPGGGMAYFIAQDAHSDPYLSAYTALAFNWLTKDGYHIPEAVEKKLQQYLLALLRNDAVPDFYSEGMRATVRAVALAALAENNLASKADIDRYFPHVANMSLFGKASFLQAALKLNADEKIIDAVVTKLLASSNQTAGKFMFSETLDDGYARILATPLRDNCAVLASLTRYAATPKGKEQLADVPFKLVRMITQSRKSRDHWENTQENMFCMQALIDYARVYESNAPDMTVKASLDNVEFGKASFKNVKDEAQTLERDIAREDAGKTVKLAIDKTGAGRLYYAARLEYALPPSESHAENSGMELRREYSVEREGKWELLKNPAKVKRGEIIRVDDYLSLPSARNFVVVDDPLPGGLEAVNSQLATASIVDTNKGNFNAAGGSWWFKYSDWSEYGFSFWNFYHKELRDNAVRFYSDYLPAGNYHLSYTAQAIATGSFTIMPAIAQEMYDTDIYGKTESISLEIGEK